MSNKKIIDEVWDSPSFEEVNKTVQSLGGIASVCRITKKHRNTVSKWCSGQIKIDYANWKLIGEINIKIEYKENVYFGTCLCCSGDIIHDPEEGASKFICDTCGSHFELF